MLSKLIELVVTTLGIRGFTATTWTSRVDQRMAQGLTWQLGPLLMGKPLGTHNMNTRESQGG